MGYSNNPITLRKIEAQLLPLLQKGTFVWTGLPDAAKWAYKVREGLRIALKFPNLFPQLTEVAAKYQLTTMNGAVVARWVGHELDSMEKAVALVDAAKLGATVLISPTFDQIVQAYIDQMPRMTPIVCQQAYLTNEELEGLETWAQKLGWEVGIKEETVTISKVFS